MVFKEFSFQGKLIEIERHVKLYGMENIELAGRKKCLTEK